MALHDDRKEYVKGTLDDRWLQADPFVQFSAWLEEYRCTGTDDATAFVLSTVGGDDAPDARVVLLKELAGDSLVFFTNYASKKGQDLAANPKAHALFFWPILERQVRVFGRVSKISRTESERYFASRPKTSQLGAAASQQSQPIASRDAMEAQYAAIASKYLDQVPCPEEWGGYALDAMRIEFWQGRASRLHDRIQFTRNADRSWSAQRLQP